MRLILLQLFPEGLIGLNGRPDPHRVIIRLIKRHPISFHQERKHNRGTPRDAHMTMHQHILILQINLQPGNRLLEMLPNRAVNSVLQVDPFMVAEQVVALDLLVDVVVAVGPLVHEGENCRNAVVLNYILV